jgi:hypothetical protein
MKFAMTGQEKVPSKYRRLLNRGDHMGRFNCIEKHYNTWTNAECQAVHATHQLFYLVETYTLNKIKQDKDNNVIERTMWWKKM